MSASAAGIGDAAVATGAPKRATIRRYSRRTRVCDCSRRYCGT